MNNLGCYFEIPVIDMQRAQKFYAQLFDCEFAMENIHGNEMAFFPFHKESSGVSGALAKGESYMPSQSGSLIYLSSPDIDESLRRVVQGGGTELFPKTLVPGMGYAAEFKDCEGNRVALFQYLKT